MSRRFIALATVVLLALLTAVNVSLHDQAQLYADVRRATGHLIQPTLVVCALLLATVLTLLLGAGRLRPGDLGWRRSAVLPGFAVACALWAAMQVVEAIAALSGSGGVGPWPTWAASGPAAVVGAVVAQLVSASWEETFFRGFLFTQLLQRMHLLAALAVSQAVFALSHLPNLLLGNSGSGTGAAAVAAQVGIDFTLGLLFAGLYYCTGNLFLVIGVHALMNVGLSAVGTPVDPALVLLLLSVFLLAGLAFRHPRQRISTVDQSVASGRRLTESL